MGLKNVLGQHHEIIISDWYDAITGGDPDSNYYQLPKEELMPLLGEAARAFYDVLIRDYWEPLEAFIARIAQKRFSQGFKVSDVQRTFELYRRSLMRIMIKHLPQDDLCLEMMRLHDCMVFTITRFSEFFQNIHDEFIKSHADSLEREVARRTNELVLSERKYKTLVEDINDGYFAVVKGKIAYANRSFAQMHGYLSNDIFGAKFLSFVAPESHAALQFAYQLSMAGEANPSRIEYVRLCKDGRRFPTEIIAKRSVFEGQSAEIGICRDISERTALEKKIHETNQLKALAKQAGSLAHDIRNPMSAVKMNLQMFSQTEQDPVKLQLIKTSLDEISRIELSLVEMMNLSIPFRIEKKYVSVRWLLNNAMMVMRQRIENNHLQTSVRLSRQIDMIKIDPHRIEQAILNLLFNAIEAQPDSGKIFLSTRQSRQGKLPVLEITVGDCGPGIPQEMRKHVFDPMFTQKGKGSGIGLNNVKRIIDAHGGEVRVSPRRPTGTNFVIRLHLE